MPAKGFQNVSLPVPVLDRVRKAVKRDQTYRSNAEFVKAATLRFLEDQERARS